MPFYRDHRARTALNQISATAALAGGIPGFFTPRVPSPWLQPLGTVEATSYYDTGHLAATLAALAMAGLMALLGAYFASRR